MSLNNKLSKITAGLLLATTSLVVNAQDKTKNKTEEVLSIVDNRQFLSGGSGASHGSGFLIEGGWIVTASHVIPPDYPSLKEGTLEVNGVPARLACLDTVADLALLKTIGGKPVPNAKTLKLHEGQIKRGMEFTASYSNAKGINMPVPHNTMGDFYEMPLSIKTKGNILDIINATPIRKGDGSLVNTDIKMIITGVDAIKGGFSGGPLISSKGEVIGVVLAGEQGIWGMRSHVDNIRSLLKNPACKEK